MTRALSCLALALAALACTPAGNADGAIAAAELAERIRAGTAPVILDVRSPAEFAAGHLPGAVNVPHDELAAQVTALGLAPDQELVVHCHSGPRAARARTALAALGYGRVRDLAGHWQGWRSAGLPAVVSAAGGR